MPSPSTLKQALIASAINRFGSVEAGRRIFDSIRLSKVVYKLPSEFTIFQVLLKRLKKARFKEGFDSTFGMREYVIYKDPLSIMIKVSHEVMDDVSETFLHIRYLGTSDSICRCTKIERIENIGEYVGKPLESEDDLKRQVIVYLLSDFTQKADFDKVDAYKRVKLTDEDIRLVPYIFPIRVVRRGRNHTTYRMSNLVS